MDPSLSASAAALLDFVASFESRGDYNIIFGNHQGNLPKKITLMTLNELLIHQRQWAQLYKSSAAGRYQIMSYTLESLMKDMRLSGQELFDADMQDRLGNQLLRRRGLDRFLARTATVPQFGLQLAMEWASLPVLSATQGAHRPLQRGQSYYCGDALNRALVSPERVEAVLSKALSLAHQPIVVPQKPEISMPQAPQPSVTPPALSNETPKPWYLSKGIIGGLIAVASPIIAVATHGVVKPDPASTTALVMQILEVAGPVLGGALSVWGRATATQPIGGKSATPQLSGSPPPDWPAPATLMNLPVSSIMAELPQILSFIQSIGQMIGGTSGRDIPNFLGEAVKTEAEVAASQGDATASDAVLPQDPTALTIAHVQSLADLASRMRDIAPLLSNLFPAAGVAPAPRPKPAPVPSSG